MPTASTPTRTESAIDRFVQVWPGIRLAFVCLLGTVVLLLPAQAAGSMLTGAASLRDCTKTALPGCAPRYKIAAGTTVKMHCWIDDSKATGAYSSDRWFYVTTAADRKGFVHSSWVADQTVTPKCRTHRGIATSRWASEHVGVATTTAAERAAIPTTTRQWSGFCATFTRAAYKLGAKYEPLYRKDARPRYLSYLAAGRVSTTGTPSVGAQIFYPNISLPFGHVAIYVGNGMVASTMGDGQAALTNARVPVGYFGAPAGWVNPDKA